MGRIVIFFVVYAVLFIPLYSQNVRVELGPDQIGENQVWTITVSVSNERLKGYDNFPDIDGFRKRGTSTQSQTSIVNGQISSTQSVVMTYSPIRQGSFVLPPFKMTINDQIISSPGKRISVGPAVQSQQRDPFRSLFERDPMENFFGQGGNEFVDVEEDAFLALTTSKEEVYIGEGFNTTLSFFVADNNRAPMQFHELGTQLSNILKRLRPSNCWEENFNIENIEGNPIEINGKFYTQYKIYQATFYPLNAQPIAFPSVGLEMIKFKVAKNPSFFGQNRKEDYKTFYSKAKTIKVKELPPHPLRESVAVGDYQLDERLASANLKTGQSSPYEFNIYGEGNISAIEKPVLLKDNRFDFYEPNIKQSVRRENNRVAGGKSFSYFLIPKEPGVYNLGDYFMWVFFNPKADRYDTLQSRQVVQVSGESLQNQTIESKDTGSFYDRISLADNTLSSSLEGHWTKIAVNIFILLMLGASVFLVFKR